MVASVKAQGYEEAVAFHVLPIKLGSQGEAILGIPWVEQLDKGLLTVDAWNRQLSFRAGKRNHCIQCHPAPTPSIDEAKQYFELMDAKQAKEDIYEWEKEQVQSPCVAVALEGPDAKTDRMAPYRFQSSWPEGTTPTHGVILRLDSKGKIVKEGSFEHKGDDYVDPDEEDTMPERAEDRAVIFKRFEDIARNELPGTFDPPPNRVKGTIPLMNGN